MINRDGYVVNSSIDGLLQIQDQVAQQEFQDSTMSISLLDQPGANSWPISSFACK